MDTKHQNVLNFLKTNPIQFYAIDDVGGTKLEAVLLTTREDADDIVLHGTPVGRTPLEAAQHTFDRLVGALQLRAQGDTAVLDRLADGHHGQEMLDMLARLQDLIAELKAADTSAHG